MSFFYNNKKLSNINLPKAIFLMGPTNSCKTSLAIELHRLSPVKLISVDSALIYQGMDIGTSKPDIEKLNQAPHRLLNILDPSQTYSVADFRRDALIEMNDITSSGNIPLLVGGSMLYFRVLLEGISSLPSANHNIREKIKNTAKKQGWKALHNKLLKIDPITAIRISPNDSQRISRALEVFFLSGKTLTELNKISGEKLPYQVYQFAIIPKSREILYQGIEKRFYQMLNLGFEEEVRMLFNRQDLNVNMPSIRCTGYRQMWSYLLGKISYKEMIFSSICATKQVAKRQITWLRNWKENIHWLCSNDYNHALQEILKVIHNILNT